MNNHDLQAHDLVMRFVANNFPSLDPDTIDDSTELLANGLDSLSVLELINILSDELGVQLDGGDLHAENFETVGSLVSLIASKRS